MQRIEINKEAEFVIFSGLNEFIDMSTADNYDDYVKKSTGELRGYAKDRLKQAANEKENDKSDTWRFGSDQRYSTFEKNLFSMGDERIIKAVQENLNKKLQLEQYKDLFKKMRTFKKKFKPSELPPGRISVQKAIMREEKPFLKRNRFDKPKGLKIGLDVSLTCGFDEKDYIKLITNFFLSVTLLETAGIPVKVLLLGCSFRITSKYKEQGVGFLLKDSEERFNINKFSYVGKMGFYRFNIFNAWCMHLTGDITSGLGTCGTSADSTKEHLDVDLIIQCSSYKDIDKIENQILNQVPELQE